MLLEAGTPVVTMVAKTSPLHVTHVLETTFEENLRMIAESVAWCKAAGREVIHDAEHFFDGYKLDREYALATLRAASAASKAADYILACRDTASTGLDVAGEDEADGFELEGKLAA